MISIWRKTLRSQIYGGVKIEILYGICVLKSTLIIRYKVGNFFLLAPELGLKIRAIWWKKDRLYYQ